MAIRWSTTRHGAVMDPELGSMMPTNPAPARCSILRHPPWRVRDIIPHWRCRAEVIEALGSGAPRHGRPARDIDFRKVLIGAVIQKGERVIKAPGRHAGIEEGDDRAVCRARDVPRVGCPLQVSVDFF